MTSRLMEYDRDFIDASGGAHATLLELRSSADLQLARRMFLQRQRFGIWAEGRGVFLSRELHTDRRCQPLYFGSERMRSSSVTWCQMPRKNCAAGGYLVLHEARQSWIQ